MPVSSSAASSSGLHAWSSSTHNAALARILSDSPSAQSEAQLAARFTGKGPWKSRLPDILEALEALGRARRSLPFGKPPARAQHLCVGGRSGTASGARLASPSTYFFSASRISRSNSTSSAGGAGGAGGASLFRRLICRTMMKMMNARITKLIATVMKLP